MELKEEQKRALEAAKGKDAFAFFMPTGTGKTLVALLAGLDKGARDFLVIGPVSSKEAWERESKRLGLGFINLREGRGVKRDRNVYWMNYEGTFEGDRISPVLVKTVLSMRRPRCIILDESHAIKNPYAKRTRAVMGLRRHFDFAFLLSATPSERYEELYSQFRFLLPELLRKKYSSFLDFKRKHLIVETVDSPNGGTYERVKGYRNIGEFLRLIEPYYFSLVRRVKKVKNEWIEVGRPSEELPEILERFENFTHAHMYMSGYDPLKKEWVYKDKLERLLELVNSFEEPVVIFANFLHEVERIASLLDAPFITGKTSKDTSVWKGKVLVCSYALSESVDLTKARRMVFFSYPLAWKKFYQARGRINRFSQASDTVYYYMLYTPPEKHILRLIWNKKDVNVSVLRKNLPQSNSKTLLIW